MTAHNGPVCTHRAWLVLALLLCLLTAMLSVGCSGGRGERQATDPAAALKENSKPGSSVTPLDMKEQRALVDRVWDESKGTPAARREATKDILWRASVGAPARIRALELLAEDPTDAEGADTRTLLMLFLPVEPDYAVVRRACEIIVQRGWQDLSAALVRALARQQSVIPDNERVEAVTLLALNPGKSLVEIAFAQFAREPVGKGRALERQERERAAAWDLLTRLDRDGSKRVAIASDPSFAAQGLAGELQEAVRVLGAVPVTSEQLAWVGLMRKEAAGGAWWTQTAGAIGVISAEARTGWALRHAEAARWAQQNHPEWLRASRQDLVAQIKGRLGKRKFHTREPEGADQMAGNESFNDQQKKLVWGDLLLILVVDDALQGVGSAEALWQQARRDMADQSTELGGIVQAQGGEQSGQAGEWEFKLFPPRGSQRTGDKRFIASDEMIKGSTFAIAHYHFHAQEVRNRKYAGPSPGDAEYAARFGRACLIFTPVKEGVLNADLLLPTGVCIDLGEIVAR